MLQACCAAEGSDRVGPGDAALSYQVTVDDDLSWDQLPKVQDEWGEPDLFLALDAGRVSVARIEVTPGRRDTRPHLLQLSDTSPLTARLVERDLTLATGERAVTPARHSFVISRNRSLYASNSSASNALYSYRFASERSSGGNSRGLSESVS